MVPAQPEKKKKIIVTSTKIKITDAVFFFMFF